MAMERFTEAVNYALGDPLPFTPDAIRVGGAGNLIVTDQFGHESTWNCFTGETIFLAAREISDLSTVSGLILMRDRRNNSGAA